MFYLYHRRTQVMKGDILYPLNELKEIFPDIYEEQARKYKGRETLMEMRVPILGCLWNDVLHFAAVPPEEIKKALEEAGDTHPFSVEYFKIDPHLLDPKKTVTYLYRENGPAEKLAPGNFIPYDPETVGQYATLSQETKNYYRETLAKGIRPLLYHKVPHILFQGSISVKGLEVFKV